MDRDRVLLDRSRQAFLLTIFSEGTFSAKFARGAVDEAFTTSEAWELHDAIPEEEREQFRNILDELSAPKVP